MASDKKSHNHIFKTPDNYFDKLPGIINNKLPKNDASVAFYKLMYLKPVLGVITILTFVIFWSWPKNEIIEYSLNASFEEIPKEDVKNYLLYSGITENEIINELDGDIANDFFIDHEFELSSEELEELIDVENIEEYL